MRNYSDLIVNSAFRYFQKKNENLQLIVYDEGYSSYTHDFWNSQNNYSLAHSSLNKILKMLGKKYPYEYINRALFFKPDFIFPEFPFTKERLIGKNFSLSNLDIVDINRIFEYKPLTTELPSHSVIFFEECFSEDYGDNSDLLILKEITNIIGKNNIFIKLHPRTTKDRFTSMGYKVLSNINYPWEVFAINNPSSDILQISFSSGSLVNYLFFTQTRIKSLYLFKAFPEYYQNIQNNMEIRKWFNKIENENKDCIYIPETLNDMKNYLSSYVKRI